MISRYRNVRKTTLYQLMLLSTSTNTVCVLHTDHVHRVKDKMRDLYSCILLDYMSLSSSRTAQRISVLLQGLAGAHSLLLQCINHIGCNSTSQLNNKEFNPIIRDRTRHAFCSFQSLTENPISECAELKLDLGQAASVQQHFRAQKKKKKRIISEREKTQLSQLPRLPCLV